MKILSITAGAADMYCGSCFRDNTLAAELMSQGHEVTLMPLYTPTHTDERNVSDSRIFFGGISVYLEQHFALFRHTPWIIDRLWDSSLALKLASRRSIQVDPASLGEMTVSMLKGEEGKQRKELRKLVRWLLNNTVPEIINLPNSLLIGLARPIREALNRPLCCTLQGEDLFLQGLDESYRNASLELIRKNIEFVDGFIAVSEFYAEFMSDYLHIPAHKMHVVPLGINFEGCGPGENLRRDEFTIGYFARVAPEKGLHVLCEAYRLAREKSGRKMKLEVAGYLLPHHQGYFEAIERQMNEWGFGAEFSYKGALDRSQKISFMQGIDVLSVPATYDEPKGMFLLEAMANGVPVVQPRRGAFTEIVETSGGGILVEPDDPRSLAEGLLSLSTDESLINDLRVKAFAGVREHYGSSQMAARVVEVYEKLIRSLDIAGKPAFADATATAQARD